MVETERTAAQGPAAPRQGEPCEECGAPLAVDQLYCLNCGRRRGGPRVDYRHYMAVAAAPAGVPGPPEQVQQANAEQPSAPQRDYAPLAAVGGIALLGLLLLVGVLIGKGSGGDNAASTPSVIRVPASSEESATASKAEAPGGSSKKASSGHGSKQAKSQGGSSRKADTGSAVKASEQDLEELNGESGESYETQSKNLPNEIATPGAPPPIDKSKPPGGGEGGAEVIK